MIASFGVLVEGQGGHHGGGHGALETLLALGVLAKMLEHGHGHGHHGR